LIRRHAVAGRKAVAQSRNCIPGAALELVSNDCNQAVSS